MVYCFVDLKHETKQIKLFVSKILLRVKKKTKTNSEFQVENESATSVTPVGCSNHCAIRTLVCWALHEVHLTKRTLACIRFFLAKLLPSNCNYIIIISRKGASNVLTYYACFGCYHWNQAKSFLFLLMCEIKTCAAS